MKFGAFLYKPQPVEGFDLNFYRIKSESGMLGDPVPYMYTNIACFGDNVTAAQRPDWVAVSKYGPATRKNKRYNFRWDILCMTNQEYRKQLYELIEKAAEKSPGVSLSSIHFADDGFCVCPRCIELWRESGLNWMEWRTKTVTEFIREAKEIVGDKPLFINVLPDPVLGKERFGYDYDELAKYVDAFIVPMFSRSYATVWYFETLARAFKKLLKKPVYVNLYVFGPGEKPETVPTLKQILAVSCRVARTGVDGILFLAENAQRLREFQKAALQAEDILREIENYGAGELLKLIDKWRSLF